MLLGFGAREEDGMASQPLDREKLLRGRARPGELLTDKAEGHRLEWTLETASVGGGHEAREQALPPERSREIPVELIALSPRRGERPEDLDSRPRDGGPEGPLLG